MHASFPSDFKINFPFPEALKSISCTHYKSYGGGGGGYYMLVAVGHGRQSANVDIAHKKRGDTMVVLG